MLYLTILQTSFLALSTFIAATQAVEHSSKYSSHLHASRKHRRHHARRVAGHRRAQKTSCTTSYKPNSSYPSNTVKSEDEETTTPLDASQANASDSSSEKTNTYTNSSQSSITPSSSTFNLVPTNLAVDGVALGFLPDDGDAGGSRTTMAQTNAAIGAKSAAYGWYAQAHSGTLFDGSQLLSVMDDVKACNCVFQPAVMPVGGWKGLTSSDNSQAVAIANVMKKFTDEGIPVWLRFAHEVNYYQSDGTYQGNAADFKAGWAAVAAACKQIAPEVKMWWTPNVAAASSYDQYTPDDMSTVSLVGIDYYPKSISKGTEFVTTMKAFHDKFAVDGRKFAIGETGLGYAGSQEDRVSWLKQVMSSKSQLPNMIAASWFNYEKEYDYRIVSPSISSGGVTAILKAYLAL